MAKPNLVRGSRFSLLVGDGGTPEVFTKLCGLTTRNFTIQKNTSDDFIEDCDDPDLVPQRYLNVTGIQWDLSADGRYNLDQGELLMQLAQTLDSVNMRFVMGAAPGQTGYTGYWEGFGQITNVQFGGNSGGEYASLSITIASDGPWTFYAD